MPDFQELGRSAFRSALERVGRGVAKAQERKPLPHDLLESDEDYLVVFDAAGAERSDVQVRFLDGEVQVRLDRFRDFHEGFEMRFPGRGLSLSGRAALPPDAAVDPDDAEATLTDAGTLQVRIPKSGEAKTVPVASGETEAADDQGEAADPADEDDADSADET